MTALLLLVLLHLWQCVFASTHLEYVDILQGMDATLTCRIPSDADSCYDVLWIRRQKKPPNSLHYISGCTTLYTQNHGLPEWERQRFTPTKYFSNINLRIANVTHEDVSYTYKCEMRAQNVLKEVEIRLHTPDCPSSITQKWSNTDQYEVHLNCTIDVPSLAQLTWYAPDKSQITQTMEGSQGQSLPVTLNLNELDNYRYFTCVATPSGLPQDPNGSAFCQVTPLQIPPVVDIIPSTLTVTPGDNATFTCKPRVHYPKNTYAWMMNGKPIPAGLDTVYIEDSSGAHLTIGNVSTEESNATVKCRASNEFGIRSGSEWATLYVNEHELTVSFQVSFLSLLI